VREIASRPERIHFIRPPRENVAKAITQEEQAVWAVHFERLPQQLAR
jgi:hypothetical protein